MEELKGEILKEMEEIPEEWKSKLYQSGTYEGMYWTHYGPGREFTEGYDWIVVYFLNKMSIKIFLNKHHDQCF